MKFCLVLLATYTTEASHDVSNKPGNLCWPYSSRDRGGESKIFDLEALNLEEAKTGAVVLATRHHVYFRTANPRDISDYGGMKAVLLSEGLKIVWRHSFDGGKDTVFLQRVFDLASALRPPL